MFASPLAAILIHHVSKEAWWRQSSPADSEFLLVTASDLQSTKEGVSKLVRTGHWMSLASSGEGDVSLLMSVFLLKIQIVTHFDIRSKVSETKEQPWELQE